MRNSTQRTAVAAALCLALACPAHATFSGTKKKPLASFYVGGPAGTSITGKTSDLTLNDDGVTLAVIVDLRKLSTGFALRDAHMRDNYLEVKRFPFARLEVDAKALAPPHVTRAPSLTPVERRGAGKLTLHGVTRSVSFTYRASCDANGICDVAATMPINMNDFGIEVLPMFGLTVRSEVKIEAQFQVQS